MLECTCTNEISSYQKISEKLGRVYLDATEESMKQAALDVKGAEDDSKRIVDTCVAIDGAWQKQGYSLLNGVVVAT